MKKERKTRHIDIRLTEKDFAILKQQADGILQEITPAECSTSKRGKRSEGIGLSDISQNKTIV